MIPSLERILLSAPSVHKENLWHWHDRQKPINELIAGIDPSHVVDFVRGSNEIVDKISNINSSVIYVPERGGGAISWAVSEIAEIQNISLPSMRYLLVGNHTDVETYLPYSPKHRIKKKVLEMNPQLFEFENDTVQNPILIDEKTGGRSSKYVASQLLNKLRENNNLTFKGFFHLIALQYRTPKVDHYSGITNGQHQKLRPTIVEAQNPFVDRAAFLDTIIDPPNLPEDKQHLAPGMLKHLHNVEAEKLIRLLSLAVTKNHILPDLIEHAKHARRGNTNYLESKDPDLLKFYNYLSGVSMEGVSLNQLIRWFEELHDVARSIK